MKEENNNIFTVFDETLNQEDKENLLDQKSLAIWLTGLSGSGKTTIAKGLEQKLHQEGFLTKLLDGDNIRVGICNNLGFSEEDRSENIRRIAEVTKLFVNCGIITINAFVSPTIQIRNMAKQIVGEDIFVEVYINTSLEECEKRDTKGLYKKARKGEIKDFTGISAPFEAPVGHNIEIITENQTVEDSVLMLYKAIIDRIKMKK